MGAAAKVFQNLSKDYPPEAIAWIHHASWSGPAKIPDSHIDPDMSAFDIADPTHVADFVQQMQAGKKLKPVILVKRPGKPRLQLVDGHHRYLAWQQEKKKPRAFIGTVDSDEGPWQTMHAQQQDGATAPAAGGGAQAVTTTAVSGGDWSGNMAQAVHDRWAALAGALAGAS